MASDSSQHDDETRPTVFIVDDDLDARQSLRSVVTAMGLAAESFASAESFWDSGAFLRPGCLVTDLRMPGMDGLELQRRLAAGRSVLPVIVVSGHADVTIAVQVMGRGAVTLLQKPFRTAELCTAIKTAIKRNAEARQEQRQRRAVETIVASLTFDENRVLKQMLAGKSNKAIAMDLDIGRRTVERRRHQIFEKFGTNSIVELTRLLKNVGE